MKAPARQLIVLGSDATAADLDEALRAAQGAKELIALIPGHLSPPEGVPALVTDGVSERFLESLRRSIGEVTGG